MIGHPNEAVVVESAPRKKLKFSIRPQAYPANAFAVMPISEE